MSLELDKEDKAVAIASLMRYFEEHMEERIGNVAAGGLLGFFLAEIGPCLYNQGVRDAQERMQMRAAELDIEVHEEAFTYWKSRGSRR